MMNLSTAAVLVLSALSTIPALALATSTVEPVKEESHTRTSLVNVVHHTAIQPGNTVTTMPTTHIVVLKKHAAVRHADCKVLVRTETRSIKGSGNVGILECLSMGK